MCFPSLLNRTASFHIYFSFIFFSFVVAQRSCGCPLPGIAQGQVGWSSEQPGLVEDVPAHGRGIGTRWSLRSRPTQTILWFYNIYSFHFLAVSPSCSLGSSLDWPSSLSMSVSPTHMLAIRPSFSHCLLVPLNSILSLAFSLCSATFQGQAHLSDYSSSVFYASRGRSRFSAVLALLWDKERERESLWPRRASLPLILQKC